AAASLTKNSTASCRAPIAAGSVRGAARRCARSREPAAVTVRSMAASNEPRRSPASVRTSSRLLRVAWSIASVAPCASRTGGASGGRGARWGGGGAEGGARDMAEAGGGGGGLEPRQRAEACGGGEREIRREPALGGRAVEHVARQRRHRRQRAQIRGERGIAVERVRDDDLARLEAGDLGA